MIRLAFKLIGGLCCLLAAAIFALGIWLNVLTSAFGSGHTYDASATFITVDGETILLPYFEFGLWLAGGTFLLAGICSFAVSGRTRRTNVESPST